MREIMRRLLLAAAFASVFAAGMSAPAPRAARGLDYRVGAVEIAGPWARATPKGATVTAGYMRLANRGTKPERLLAGRAAVGATFEIQEMSLADNVMRLRTLANGLEIRPGQTIELKPGAPHHFVFARLARQLVPGDAVRATLLFEQAGAVEIEFAVLPIGARGLPEREAAAE